MPTDSPDNPLARVEGQAWPRDNALASRASEHVTPGALAVILARAGSKGLPRKNVLPVAGEPCIHWTIEDCRRARLLARTVVSTDDGEIAAIAHARGLKVIPRPADLASDHARVDDAVRHAVACVDATHDPIVILYANVPIRPEGVIDGAILRLVESAFESVQSFTPVGKHHPWWTARVDDRSGELSPWEGTTLFAGVHRRQQLPPAFVPDGAVTVVRRGALLASGPGSSPHAFLGTRRGAVTTPEGSVVDIDTKIDLVVADAMLRERLTGSIGPPREQAPHGRRSGSAGPRSAGLPHRTLPTEGDTLHATCSHAE